MKRLELKYLALYLPFGLYIEYKSQHMTKVYRLTALDDGENYQVDNGGNQWNSFDGMKPILYPLSHIDFEFALEATYISVDHFVDAIKSKQVEVDCWLELHSRHYDVHGLIDAGLAIDKCKYKVIEI